MQTDSIEKAVGIGAIGLWAALHGWLGWLVVLYAVCMMLDWVTGTVLAIKNLVLFHKYFYFFFTFFRSCLSDIYIFHSLARSTSSSPEQQRGVRVQQPGQRVIHGIGIAALSQALGAQLVEGCFCQPILCRRHRQLAACGQIVHPQDEPSRFFGTAAAGALAVVDIAQRPEQDAFVGTVEFNFTFQFFLQCQLYIGKRLRFALKAIQLKKFQK